MAQWQWRHDGVRRRRWRQRQRHWQRPRGQGRGGGGGSTDAYGGGGSSGVDGGWTPSPTLREQPLEREETPFFSQMTARVYGVVHSPLIKPKMSQEGKGPT